MLKNEPVLSNCMPSSAIPGEDAFAILLEDSPIDPVLIHEEKQGMDSVSTHPEVYLEIPHILLNSKADKLSEPPENSFYADISFPENQDQFTAVISHALPEFSKKDDLDNTTIAQKNIADFTAHQPVHILLAEDNLINQKIFIHMLSKLGFQSDIVQNGKEALTAVTEKNYDIVFMDVQMPEMDGLEATREIRKLHKVQPVIVAMTANSMEGDKEDCLVSGMNDYISKPIHLESLRKIMEKFSIIDSHSENYP